ncbi:MAG: MFS transporter [Terracidiphilus sp.]|nr:MFS transporter [Terracidiphilus sp.]
MTNIRTLWTPRRQILLVFLLFLIATINYFDRQSLSVVAPRLQAELHIDDQGYAHIVGLFLFASAIAYAVAGFISDWIGTRRAMALFVGWWSLAEAATALVSNTVSLGIARFCLGLGEPGLWVAAPKMVGETVKVRHRALAVGVYSMGGSLGAVIALPTIAMVTSHWPWRSIFVLDGAVGLLWLPLWFAVTHRRGQEESVASPALKEPRTKIFAQILSVMRRSTTWKLVAARALTDPVWYFYLFWFPKYLMNSRHMNLEEVAQSAWFVYVGAGIGALTGGLFASMLIRRGLSTTIAYRWILLGVAVILPLSPLAAIVPGNELAILFASLMVFAHMNWLVILTSSVVELYPAAQVGTAGGLIASGSGIGGMLSSELIGCVVMTNGYTPLFVVMGLFHPLVLVLIWTVFNQQKKAICNQELEDRVGVGY